MCQCGQPDNRPDLIAHGQEACTYKNAAVPPAPSRNADNCQCQCGCPDEAEVDSPYCEACQHGNHVPVVEAKR